MNKNDQNTDYDMGYFQAVRDISMIITGLSAYYNAKDVQKIIKQIKEHIYITSHTSDS